MSEKENNNNISVPTLAQNHYYIFSKEFDQASTTDAITFILERNLMLDRPKNIRMIINSQGGELPSCFALCDVIEASSIPVHMYGLGMIASAAVTTFMTGKKGHRYITDNTSIMSHQFSDWVIGKEHELIAYYKEIQQISERIINHYKKHTGQSEKIIKQYLLPAEDVYLSAKEAVKYGVADHIMKSWI